MESLCKVLGKIMTGDSKSRKETGTAGVMQAMGKQQTGEVKMVGLKNLSFPTEKDGDPAMDPAKSSKSDLQF